MRKKGIPFLLLFLAALFLSTPMLGQSGDEDSRNPFSLDFSVGYLYSGLMHKPVIYTLCFEGCTPIEQQGGGNAYYALTAGWEFLPGAHLKLGVMTHTRKIEETLEGYFFGNIFTIEDEQKYYGLHPGIQLDIIRREKFTWFIENGLLFEKPDREVFRLRDTPISYTNKIGLIINTRNEHLSVSLNSLAFIPLHAYFREEPFAGYEPYLPFSVGGAAGLRYSF